MDRAEAFRFISFLSDLRPPALLISGGEPLTHPDFFTYLEMTSSAGLKIAVSTNGVLFDDSVAAHIASFGVPYVGVSVDGVGGVSDAFRGVTGAFQKAVNGIEALASAGCRVGLRITLTRPLLPRLESILALALDLPISRICFYHFIPAGRGALDAGLSPESGDERRAVGRIISWADKLRSRGGPLEVLTVGDASDGDLVYEYLRERDPVRAEAAGRLLRRFASRGSGGMRSVRWDGLLFPNQFSWDRPLGHWRDLARDK
jgi:MoaA/NifB/PqqE/SkfB family radical SAM enzyme